MTFRQMLYLPFQVTGIDIRRCAKSLRGLGRYVSQCWRFRQLSGVRSMPLSFCAPCTADWYEACGNAGSPYLTFVT